MLRVVDLEKYFIEVPFVTQPGASPLQFVAIRLAELVAPASDGLVAELHSPSSHHELDISQAQAEGEVQPDALRDDLLGKAMLRYVSAGTQSGSHEAYSSPM